MPNYLTPSYGSGITRQYPGSSGYWAGDPSMGPHGGYNASYGGLPGAAARVAGGFPLSEAERRTPPNNNLIGTNPYGYGAGVGRGFGAPASPLGSPGSNSPSGFQTLNNVRSPMFQNQINTDVSALNQTAFNPSTNPNVLRDNVRNPAIQSAANQLLGNPNAGVNPRDFTRSGEFQTGISQAYSQADSDRAANRDQFNNFLNLFNSQTPSVTSNVNQENQSINDWYDPNGVQGNLDSIAAARSRAVNLSGNRALDRVGRNNALLRMSQGDSSYANQQALDTSASIYADEARQQADLARENYLTTKSGQASLLGARNRGNDYLVNRQTLPISLRSQIGAGEDARLGGIGSMDLSNNIYTTPAEQANQRAGLLSQLSQLDSSNNVYTLDNPQNDLARRVGILSQLGQLNNANNFYGLSRPYDNVSGNNLPSVSLGNSNSAPALRVSGGRNNLVSNQPVNNALAGNAHSAADELYRQQTGVYPQDDSNVSDVSLQRARALASQGFTAQGNYWYNPVTGQYIDPNTGQPLRNSTANTASFGGAQDYYNNLQRQNAINPDESDFYNPIA